jgi:multidrug efflux pump subunit AcrA (membrane-fusion protein)
MNSPRRAAATGLLLALLTGCASAPSGIVVSGTVEDTVRTVSAPSLTVPAVSLDAGFTDHTGAYNPVTGTTAVSTSTVGAAFGVGSTVRIASVEVAQGDRVTAGQTIATLDASALSAALATAQADAQAARANVGLIGDAIETTYDKESDVRDAKKKVRDAIDKIHDGQAKLLTARATIEKNLPLAKAGLAQVEAAIAALPPGVPVPQELQDKEKELKAAVAKMQAGLKTIEATLPRLADGLKKAKQGLKKLEDATSKIIEARGTLRGQKDLLQLIADAAPIQVDVVRAQLALATVTSPAAGVVVSVAAVGDQLAPGATVAEVRETGPSTLTAWLSPAQLGEICQGDQAAVAADWTGTTTPATITRIGTRADYPPTSVATDEVHLTRAVEVELTTAAPLPAGVPVEVTIQGCRQAASQNNTNG